MGIILNSQVKTDKVRNIYNVSLGTVVYDTGQYYFNSIKKIVVLKVFIAVSLSRI